MSRFKVLAVDDNSDGLYALEQILIDGGYDVVTAASGKETLSKVQQENPDIVLLDVQMPPPDGHEVTRIMKSDERYRFTPILLLTAKDALEDVIEGLEIGADDYIKKPYNQKELLARLQAALRTKQVYGELRQALDETVKLRRELGAQRGYPNIIGNSESMKSVFRVLDKVKDSTATVLITGESGSGKELIAQALHYSSIRKDKPFVAQNVSALQDTLLESELFGHVRGSFTGAVKDKLGLFAVADGGTLFLDELGEMSASMQSKLLRVLQEGTFVPVGDTKPKKVDVRVIGATHRKLDEMIERGEFREDLYYRLNVISIDLPPLRERREDIPVLLEKFLKDQSSKYSMSPKQLAPETLELLRQYDWPGNIRQLQNEVERMVLLSGENSHITSEVLSPKISGKKSVAGSTPEVTSATSAPRYEYADGTTLKDAVDRLEKQMIESAMKQYNNNKSEVAKRLGISRSSLIQKVQSYETSKG